MLPLREPDPLTGLRLRRRPRRSAHFASAARATTTASTGGRTCSSTQPSSRSDCGAIGCRALRARVVFPLAALLRVAERRLRADRDAKPSGDGRSQPDAGPGPGHLRAAGDPRSGSLGQAPSRPCLTLFSARAGSWIEKPKPDGWSAASPRYGDLPLAASFGLSSGGAETSSTSSGGEEFERLGVYELIRRRCRYVIAVDAGDGGDATAGLQLDPALSDRLRRPHRDRYAPAASSRAPTSSRASGRRRPDPLRRCRPGRDARRAHLRQAGRRPPIGSSSLYRVCWAKHAARRRLLGTACTQLGNEVPRPRTAIATSSMPPVSSLPS